MNLFLLNRTHCDAYKKHNKTITRIKDKKQTKIELKTQKKPLKPYFIAKILL